MALDLLKQIIIDGKPCNFDGAGVIDRATGKTFSEHIADKTVHLSQADIDKAINILKDGTTDGSGNLTADYDTLLKLANGLSALKTTITTFLEGEPDEGDIDRLSEVLKEIKANKDSIAAITSDRIAKEDIVDSLTSTDATKVLSAAQGKALKDLIDALEESVNTAIADIHSHENLEVLSGISKNEAGFLTFNNVALDGSTGIAVVAKADQTPEAYNAKVVYVVEAYTPPTQTTEPETGE